MNLKKAVNERTSRRTYLNTEIPPLAIEKILNAIWECNKSGNLNIQLVLDNADGIGSIRKTYGIITGAKNYIALIGEKENNKVDEMLGYYGESLVLLATELGLGTCWVGGTFDKDVCNCKISENEELKCIIVFGNVAIKNSVKELLLRKTIKRKSKEIKDMIVSIETPPNWVVEGMKCVVKAPSTKNRQPVKFYYSGGAVSAKIQEKNTFTYIDLGIAKLHFKIGAKQGNWDFGNGGIFEYEDFSNKR